MDLTNVLKVIAPGYVARRLDAKRRLLISERLYEAASTSQYRPTFGSGLSPDATMEAAGSKLRQIGRTLDENHDLTVGVLDDLVNNIVGDGVRVSPMIRTNQGALATDLNQRLADLWDEWSDYPEVTGELGRVSMDRLVCRSWLRDGEMFSQAVENARFNYRTRVPLAFELLEADYCPVLYEDEARGIRQGIARNQWGAPQRYFFYKVHPGDSGYIGAYGMSFADLKSVAAERVLHVKFTRRLKQSRGVPVLHSVINRLRDVKDYEESERIAAKVAADMTAFIKRNSEYQGSVSVDDSTNNRTLTMSAGAIYDLLPGEDVSTIQSNRPNNSVVDFTKHMLRAIAAGTSTRYSAIARDYNGTYSAQRQELVEAVIGYRAHHAYLVRAYYRPMWRRFVDAAFQTGALDLLDLQSSIDLTTLQRADFRPPAIPWIDPLKEANAWKTLIDAKLESREEIMRQRGRDPDKVREELEAESELEIFEQMGAMQPMPEEDDDDEETQQDNDGEGRALRA